MRICTQRSQKNAQVLWSGKSSCCLKSAFHLFSRSVVLEWDEGNFSFNDADLGLVFHGPQPPSWNESANPIRSEAETETEINENGSNWHEGPWRDGGGKRIGLGDGTPHVTTTSVVNCSKYIGPKELTWWCHRNKTKKVERKRRRLFRHDFLRSYRQQHAEHSLVCFDRSPFAAAFPPAQSSRRFIAAPASGRGVQHISLPLEPSRLSMSS